MKRKTVGVPYLMNRLPSDAVLYGDLGAAHAALRQHERAGDTHLADRARRRIRQLDSIIRAVEDRTCSRCHKRLNSATDRKAHERLACGVGKDERHQFYSDVLGLPSKGTLARSLMDGTLKE